MDRFKILLVVLILLIPISVAITPEDKAYIDQSNNKIVAQINSKIDSTSNRFEQDMKTKFDSERNIVIDEISNQVKSHLKTIAMGLSGMIIITLAIFRIFDIKISMSKNIKKYENTLKKQIEEMKQAQKDLIEYKLRLEHERKILYNRPIQPQPNLLGQITPNNPQNVNVVSIPKPKKKFKIGVFLTILSIVLLFLGMVSIGFYTFFMR